MWNTRKQTAASHYLMMFISH